MKRHLFLCITICFATHILTAQSTYWEAGVGPYGGWGTLFPTNSNLMYCSDFTLSYQYYRSTDYGEHWTAFDISSIDTSAVSETIKIGRSGTFYGLVEQQVDSSMLRQFYRSTDEGAQWTLRNNPHNLTHFWETPTLALIGTDTDNNMYRSTDGGLNWLISGNLNMTALEYPMEVIFGNNGKIFLFNRGHSLFYSLDDGQSWSQGDTWDFHINSGFDMTLSGTLFRFNYRASPSDTILYRSTDWGGQWTVSDIELEDNEYLNSILELSNGRLLLASSRQIYVSDDDGLSWEVFSSSPEKASRFFTNAPLSNGLLIGSNKGALFRSSDSGVNWTFSSFGIQLANTFPINLLNDSLQLAVTWTGLWRSANAGNSWDRLLPDTSSYYYNESIVHPERPLAVLNADSFAVSMDANAWRTTDGGLNFQKITPPNKLAAEYIFAGNGGRLFATDSIGIIRSNDFGLSWQSVFPGKAIMRLKQHPGGTLFAIIVPLADSYNSFSLDTIHTLLYRSQDNGANWENIEIPGFAAGALFLDIAWSNQGELYVSAYFNNDQYAIGRSVDLGETWTTNLIPYTLVGSPLILNTLAHIFTVTYDRSVSIICSIDQGQSWFKLPPFSSTGALVTDMQISPSGHLYVLSGPVYRSRQSTQNGGYLRGQVLRDADAECSTPDAQEGLKNWVVEIKGEYDYVVSTSDAGAYAFYGDMGVYNLHARVPQTLWWSICDSLLTVQLDSAQTVDSLDFVGVALSECPLVSVDLIVPQLRRCFNNSVYVSYCNSGSEAADSAWVDIELDPFLSLVSSVQTHEFLGDNTYRFHLGDVDWGDCGQFSFTVYVDCDSTVIGQTHCITAHAFPDTLCNEVPSWSGANIEAQANCQDSLVQLRLQNTGTNPSTILNYIIIEDDVVLLQGQEQYEIGESITLEYAANGSTWRIESQQEPGHPFSNLALAFLEGCGGFQSLGFINQFSINGWVPSTERSCVENTGSYDPNDKQGFPLGYGTDRRIRPGQALEYLIRFQNTGTDTAFTVQIRDTLSPWLDPATLRPGAASHPYTWSLSGPGVLVFRFDHILLPDSNVNLIGSQGFVSFKIDQRPEVPLETQILNSAAIYFDFNDPVITNQTLHTVGIDYITSVQDVAAAAPSIGIQPNPALNETLLHLPEDTERLTLTDVLGRQQGIFRVQGPRFRLERGNLPAGVYWLRAEDKKGKVTGVGKVVWH